MSILLDALKKSEEQRQLGKAPDIHSPEGTDSAYLKGRKRWMRPAAVALIALLIAWFGWQQFHRADPVVAPSVDTAQVAARAAVDDTPAGQSQQAVASKSRVNRSFTTFQADPKVSAEQVTAEQSLEPANVQQDVATPAGLQQESKAPASPPEPAPRTTEPISYWELPQSVRDSLPELRITVLVYAERPEDRFLLMAGQRMVEKDEYQQGIVLDEIRRDGAVFLYRNYRFLVKG